MNIITRFAPSPTGYLHLGNIRTAIFSWLFARKNNGKFLIRIEDTDINRCKDKYIDNIFFILEWLGIYWDDKPVYQSKRLDIYKEVINMLLNKGLAYKCYCTLDRLLKVKNIYLNKKKKPIYDGFCRNNIKDILNKKYVIRFKNFNRNNIYFNDEIFGNIKFNKFYLDDFIIQRSNGIPTYNFCVVVDDFYMSISNIIRGCEHINNTPNQINLINSLCFNIPKYCHLPLLLDENNKKLSKRNKLSNLNYYINKGFLPDSIINYLLRLGWSYKNLEIFNINDIKKFFIFKNFNKSPCIINYKKILWINKFYISNLNKDKLIFYLKPFFIKNNIDINSIKNLHEFIFLIINRVFLLMDIVNFYILINNIFDISYKFLYKYKLYYVKEIIYFFKNKLNKIIFWSLSNIRIIINKTFKKFSYNKNIFKILRYILIGKELGLNLDIIIFILKKDNVLLRLNKFKY